ncbi:C4-dicarboxylate transporter DctA [Pseudomonas syringae]|uniref:C4-dicarboxylate transport protein n=1 Tax=Pseudomonas syringae pv. aptata TaxID=83167 RepID=A0A0Q0D0A9_PSEAP|nr:C4-dicarboxylate transporter DctA [Pseudomonas syringae]KPY99817.1 C4-dicarboxylate transport protein [Pseudomonas syringae pv. aptata]MBI6674761.1 C4-dicarboxylate transporter DctA [Pseudomonas syringae]MDP5166556.1 C4-dicarboxylate transporter DctA [Pseudomonas syringae pv. aptata str. DSM 50252]RMO47669.1 Aerobic C4-dicarboxylate transport protein [Pseudomonas syringae]RMO63638.1 C4-dicarboxylate transport protein [Pseudomonas syringae pv. aptata]
MEISKTRWYSQLYVQVLIGIVLGAAIGYFEPDVGAKLQPFADGFIKLIKMLLAPIIFGTVVVGIAKMGSIKEVGRIGVKALVYFEILSTIALVIGLIVVNIVKPGAGMNINAGTLDGSAVSKYSQAASEQGGTIEFFLNIIPTTFLGAFSNGVMLQVILLSVLMGVALVQMGETSKPLINTIDLFLQGLFRIVAMVMRLAPLGAGAGMAFTIGKYGIGTLLSLGQLLVALYITTLIFIVVVLGSVARWSGMPLLQFIRYFKDEILITLGTCSTEAVLPRMMVKLEKLGCKKSVVGMVLPTGYTFNADGTCIYLTMAAIFIAQATNTPLTFVDQMILLGVFLLTSKGSAGVAGAGFVTLTATLTTIHSIPLVGLVLLLGIDRFLNEARAVTNLIGNGIGTLAIAKWDNSFDAEACESEIAAMNNAKAARKALLAQK